MQTKFALWQTKQAATPAQSPNWPDSL